MFVHSYERGGIVKKLTEQERNAFQQFADWAANPRQRFADKAFCSPVAAVLGSCASTTTDCLELVLLLRDYFRSHGMDVRIAHRILVNATQSGLDTAEVKTIAWPLIAIAPLGELHGPLDRPMTTFVASAHLVLVTEEHILRVVMATKNQYAARHTLRMSDRQQQQSNLLLNLLGRLEAFHQGDMPDARLTTARLLLTATSINDIPATYLAVLDKLSVAGIMTAAALLMHNYAAQAPNAGSSYLRREIEGKFLAIPEVLNLNKVVTIPTVPPSIMS